MIYLKNLQWPKNNNIFKKDVFYLINIIFFLAFENINYI